MGATREQRLELARKKRAFMLGMPYRKRRIGGGGGVPDQFMQEFGVPEFGASTRLLNKDYGGSLYEVTAYDGSNTHGSAGILGFKFGNEYWIDLDSKLINLDAAALARGLTENSTYRDLIDAHGGGANYDGLITKWSDQSGNNNHALQSAISAMPKGVEAGNLVTENGKPAIDFDGVDDGFIRSVQSSSIVTTYVVTNPNDIGGAPQMIYNGDGLRVSEYDDEIIAQIQSDIGATWTKSGDVGNGPLGLAVYDGKLYVACLSSDDVYVYDGSSWTKSGNVGNTPFGLAVYDGKLYASCFGSDDVYVYDGSSWSKSGDVGNRAYGLAVYDGKLYVSCDGSDDVYVYDGSSWTKSGDVGNKPFGLAVYDGKLYASCFGSDDVYVYDGSSWTKSGDVGNSPRGFAVYDGKLYVSCTNSDDVYMYDGSSWTKNGDVGNRPLGLAVYDGKLYVSCNGSNDVYVYGSGDSIYMNRSFSPQLIYTQDTGTLLSLAINSGNIINQSHTVSRNLTGELRIALAQGSTQSGLTGGNDEDFKGKIMEINHYTVDNSTNRNVISNNILNAFQI